MLGELYYAALTAAAFDWICSLAVTELEIIVLDWLAQLLHLTSCYLSSCDGGGVIQGSASEAIVVMMVLARDRYLRQSTLHLKGKAQEDAIAQNRVKLVALGSDGCHSSTQKAAMIVGFRYRCVPTNSEDNFSMRGEHFSHVLQPCGKGRADTVLSHSDFGHCFHSRD